MLYLSNFLIAPDVLKDKMNTDMIIWHEYRVLCIKQKQKQKPAAISLISSMDYTFLYFLLMSITWHPERKIFIILSFHSGFFYPRFSALMRKSIIKFNFSPKIKRTIYMKYRHIFNLLWSDTCFILFNNSVGKFTFKKVI